MSEDKAFNQRTEDFVNFLTENGVIISPKIRIVDLRHKNEGRGIIATEDIQKDEALFTIPKTLPLDYKNCGFLKNDEHLEEKLEKYSSWEILIICMFYELKVLEDKSKWWPYFQVLPICSKFQNLIYWSDDELNLLEPSLILKRIGKAESLEMYDNISENGLKDFGLSEYQKLFTLDLFHIIATLIQSYSFDIEKSELYPEDEKDSAEDQEFEIEKESDQIKAMVCLADTLNSNTHLVNANLTYEQDGTLVMKATKKISTNGQVYNIYGNHPNSELLRMYGYVEWNRSKYDFGEVSLDLIKQTFRKTYNVDLELINEVLHIVSKDQQFNENFLNAEGHLNNDDDGDENEEEDNQLITEYYECYLDGMINPEFYFILQILTSLLEIQTNKEINYRYSDLEGLEEKKKFIKRFTKKLCQLINLNKITEKCHENYIKVLESRISEYPEHLINIDYQTLVPKDKGNVADFRKVSAQFVLKCELDSLENCKKFFVNQKFDVIEDKKLTKNLLKKYIEEEQSTNKKRRIMRKNGKKKGDK